ARHMIATGDPFAVTAHRFSIDAASRDIGGRRLSVARGLMPRAVDSAIFRSHPGQLSPVIATSSGFYVFEVTRIHRSHAVPRGRSRAMVKLLLRFRRGERALAAL